MKAVDSHHILDDANLWRGHASMVQEISTDLNVKPDAIFCSVGGAGLLAGVMVGCNMVGWDDGIYDNFIKEFADL